MQKTDKIKLDIDLIPEDLYQRLIEVFKQTRKDVVCVNDIEISAIIEFEE